MIQRIQTVYLLISCILLAFLLAYPLAEIVISEDEFLLLRFDRIESYSNADIPLFSIWPLAFLLVSTIIIGILSIFFYKNRILQMRLCVFNIILLFGLSGMIIYITKSILHRLEGRESVFLWPFVLLFVAIILTYLAFKRIQKDEKLVRSYDRIR